MTTVSSLTPHVYTVGQALGITPPAEGHMPVFNRGSFDILAFFSGLNSKAIKDWQKGKVAYGVFIDQSIPFFLLDLGRSWTLDIYFNILLESKEQRQLFFEGDPNQLRVNLYLISFADAVVRAVRSIDLDAKEMMRIKEACFDQISRYPSKDECFVEAELILSQQDSKALRKQVRMHPG